MKNLLKITVALLLISSTTLLNNCKGTEGDDSGMLLALLGGGDLISGPSGPNARVIRSVPGIYDATISNIPAQNYSTDAEYRQFTIDMLTSYKNIVDGYPTDCPNTSTAITNLITDIEGTVTLFGGYPDYTLYNNFTVSDWKAEVNGKYTAAVVDGGEEYSADQMNVATLLPYSDAQVMMAAMMAAMLGSDVGCFTAIEADFSTTLITYLGLAGNNLDTTPIFEGVSCQYGTNSLVDAALQCATLNNEY